MAKGYRAVDRDQNFLLPPDMREWLPADHPVWLVIDAVSAMDTTAFHRHRRIGGVGRAGFDPDMLLTLLVWAWAQGVVSSRRIERACQQDVAFRIICAGDVPDHVTISRFRAHTGDAMTDLFTQVLLLCRRMGMGQLGVIALDGVKIGCDASMSANRTEEGLVKAAEKEQSQRDRAAAAAAHAAAAHAATDAAEDDLFGAGEHGDQAGPASGGPSARAQRIAAALADLQAQHDQERAAADQKAADYLTAAQAADLAGGHRPAGSPPAGAEVQVAEFRLQEFITAEQLRRVNYAQRLAAAAARGHRIHGSPPRPIEELYHFRRLTALVAKAHARVAKRDAKQSEAKAVRNLTDVDSRLMTLRGGGWLQGYNCQAVTSSDGLIIAHSVNNNPADVITYRSMSWAAEQAAVLMATEGEAGQAPHSPRPPKVVLTKGRDLIGLMLADTGYLSIDNLTAPGPDRLIAVGKSREVEKAARLDPTEGPPPADADPITAMAHRLRTPEGIANYRLRSHIAETPFGHAKHNLRFRRFTTRGLHRAQAEWAFHASVHNLFKAIGTGHLNQEARPATA